MSDTETPVDIEETLARAKAFARALDGQPYYAWVDWTDAHGPIEHVAEVDPEPLPVQQRALPRPSTTPPMWADDPTRSRRPRRNRNQPNRQGIA